MPHFTIRYSGSGTGVLRVECVTVEDAAAAMAEARRRLAVSRTFSSAEVFDAAERFESGRLPSTPHQRRNP